MDRNDTALRDVQERVARGVLRKSDAGGGAAVMRWQGWRQTVRIAPETGAKTTHP
ncbi:MAG: hypothetical protein PHI55_05955 [Burkholderiaceae bacterium]|nr:hypothetical protein [Burkholderiaceae bacterium]